MKILILLAMALLAVAALWLHLGALALVIAPLSGLFLLLTLAPLFVETLETELAEEEGQVPAPAVPVLAVDTGVRWGVLYIADR